MTITWWSHDLYPQGEILEDQVAARKEELSATAPVFEGLLEDIQQRLVYRAQKYILSDIAGYAHSPGDLAYPDKLIVAVSLLVSLVLTHK